MALIIKGSYPKVFNECPVKASCPDKCLGKSGCIIIGEIPDNITPNDFQKMNQIESGWHTGTPTVNDPFYIREVFILQFVTPKGDWYFHGHLFKPDFQNKRFRSWVDKNITFAFDCPDLRWQKIEENEDGHTD